jgi:hypothetical protein
MFNQTYTLTGTTPVPVPFGKPYRRINIVQISGNDEGTVTVAPLVPGESTHSALSSSANSMDLTESNVVFKVGSNGDQIFSGVQLTPASLNGDIVVRVIAFDSVGL